jgi:NADH dehydrogenase
MAPLDLVTGAFSNAGSHIARRLLDAGRRVRTLSFHPSRPHQLQTSVEALPYRFDDPDALACSLEGVSTLYNTYWVRFDHGHTTFEQAVERSRALFIAAQRAGVERIVHLSITNPSISSPLPYFRGKALVEDALAQAGVPYSIVRPTWIFGGDQDTLVNNIAWILRRMPVFTVPGSGAYPVPTRPCRGSRQHLHPRGASRREPGDRRSGTAAHGV